MVSPKLRLSALAVSVDPGARQIHGGVELSDAVSVRVAERSPSALGGSRPP